MPAAFVQAAIDIEDDGNNTLTLTFPGNLTLDNHVIVAVFYSGGLAADEVTGISGPVTGAARCGGDTSDFDHEVWYARVNASGQATITVNLGSSPGFQRIAAHEVSGLQATGAFDKYDRTLASSTTSPTSPSVTPATDGQYIFGASMDFNVTNASVAPAGGSGYTERTEGAGSNGVTSTQDQVQATAAAITAGFTWGSASNGWAIIATFRAAAAVPEPQGEVQLEGAGVTDRILLEDSSGVIQLEAGAESGTTFTASLAGGATPSGALTMRINKALTGAATPAGAVLKRGSKLLAGGATPAGSLTKRGTQSMAGGATPAGALAALKLSMVSLAGGATPAGSLTKRGGKELAGGATPAGSLTKRGSKAFAGGATPAGAVTMIRVILVSLAGSAAPSGTLTRRANKALAGGVTPTGALLKRVSKLLAGGVTPSGIALAQKVFLRSLSGSAGSSGTLTRRGGKALTGVVIPTGDVRLRAGKNLVGVLTPQGTLNRRHPLFLGGVVTPTGALERATSYRLSLGGVLMPVGTLTKRAHKFLAGGVTPSGILLIGSTLATRLVYDLLEFVPFTTLDMLLSAGGIESLEFDSGSIDLLDFTEMP